MQLTIVIPVLNEEESVEQVARNCLDARPRIVAETPVRDVHVVVVSDGSTDRTLERARRVEGVVTVALEQNQGYGAAIQRGWRERPAELLAFLDGDGTCDAHFFVPLIQALEREGADVALGSRMGEGSRMPAVRRLGNWLFALLLGLLSRTTITDSASGMRVVRKSALKHLLPLPTGLHFTPAMSARALLGGRGIVEVPMPYAERAGRSKLSVLKDGLRFSSVILSTTAYVRPSRLTFPVIGLLLLSSLLIGAMPTLYYASHGRLQEWMIYRFLLIALLADVGVLLFCGTLLAEHVIALGLLRYGSFVDSAPWWWSDEGLKLYIAVAAGMVLGGAYLVWPGVVAFVATGSITFEQMHWSRVVLAAFAGLTFMQLVTTRVLMKLFGSLDARQALLLTDGA